MLKAIISDFDGTLVDTFKANLMAYQEAFQAIGLHLTEDKYRECFGSRFDRFMQEMNIYDANIAQQIKEKKTIVYPKYFEYIQPNRTLIEFIDAFHKMGGKTAIASTARKENLMNVVNYFNVSDMFDLIFAGVDVLNGKPNPEIYIKTMDALQVSPCETLIFEDSDIGIQAGIDSGARVVRV